jgi:hypothetical protein
MEVNTKSTVQSGAVVTAINGVLLNAISLFGFSSGVTDLLVVLATPASLTATWLILLAVKVWGAFTFEEFVFQRALKKELKKNRKILNGKGYSQHEKHEAKEAIKHASTLQRVHSANKLQFLSDESKNSKTSFETIVVTEQNKGS